MMFGFLRRLWARLFRRRVAPAPPIAAIETPAAKQPEPAPQRQRKPRNPLMRLVPRLRRAAPPASDLSGEPAPRVEGSASPPKRKRRVKTPKAPKAPEGPHAIAVDRHSKETLLNSLGDYFEAAARLKVVAPDDYAFFARTGCVVTQAYCAPEGGITDTNHAPIFAGGIFVPKYAADDKDKGLYPSFVYFARMRKPRVWPAGPVPHLLYRVVMIFRTAEELGWDWPVELLIARDKSGRFTALGEPHVKKQQLPPSSHERTGKVVTHVSFGLPPWLVDHWNGRKDKYPGETIHECAAGIFTIAYETYRTAVTALLISAQKNGQRAVFAVQLRDARNMFNDRDLKAASTPGGRLRPIFHYVREHDRIVTPEDADTMKIVSVRAHHRGLRDFFWNGFHVTISWPDRASTLYTESSSPMIGENAEDIRPDDRTRWLSMRQAAKRVAEAVFNYDARGR